MGTRRVFDGFAIQNPVWGVACITMGMMADRFGAGRAFALGAWLYALGLLGIRGSESEFQLYMTAGVLMGMGQAGVTFLSFFRCWAWAVPSASRTTVMGIASAGGSLGRLLIVPTGQALISTQQWSGALWILSLFVAFSIPLAFCLRG